MVQVARGGTHQCGLGDCDDASGRDIVLLLADFVEHLVADAPRACEATIFDSDQVPGVGVCHYLVRLLECMECSAKCFIVAFVYIDRFMCKNKKCHLNGFNVHRMFLAAIVVASKVLEDEQFSNADIARIGGVSGLEMNKLEAQLVTSLDWRLQVSPRECGDCIGLLRMRAERNHPNNPFEGSVLREGTLSNLEMKSAGYGPCHSRSIDQRRRRVHSGIRGR